MPLSSKKYKAVVSGANDDSEFEKQLVVLQKALTQFDFPPLRSNYKELAGNSEARIILTENPEGRPTLCINGRNGAWGHYVARGNHKPV